MCITSEEIIFAQELHNKAWQHASQYPEVCSYRVRKLFQGRPKAMVSTHTQCCTVRAPTLSRPIPRVTAYIFATKTDNISQKLYSKPSCPLPFYVPDSVRHSSRQKYRIRLLQFSAKFSLRMTSRCK